MAAEDGLICACILDRQGGGARDRLAGDPGLAARAGAALGASRPDRAARASAGCARTRGLDPVIAGGLLASDVRPRELPVDDALLVTLRGVNLNPGADPEDMVAVRIWLEPARIVSLRHRRLIAINDLREAVAAKPRPAQPRPVPRDAERLPHRPHGARGRRAGRPHRRPRGHGPARAWRRAQARDRRRSAARRSPFAAICRRSARSWAG